MSLTRDRVALLRDYANMVDGQDSGSLDLFREVATPAVVFELAAWWLQKESEAT